MDGEITITLSMGQQVLLEGVLGQAIQEARELQDKYAAVREHYKEDLTRPKMTSISTYMIEWNREREGRLTQIINMLHSTR